MNVFADTSMRLGRRFQVAELGHFEFLEENVENLEDARWNKKKSCCHGEPCSTLRPKKSLEWFYSSLDCFMLAPNTSSFSFTIYWRKCWWLPMFVVYACAYNRQKIRWNFICASRRMASCANVCAFSDKVVLAHSELLTIHSWLCSHY